MNFKHLPCLLQVAKLGGVLRASTRLHLSPQTISGQIQMLEEALGTPLFAKSGRGLVLTEDGRMVLGHAEDTFSTRAELEEGPYATTPARASCCRSASAWPTPCRTRSPAG